MQVDLKKYEKFVEAVTSNESNNQTDLINRLNTLELQGKEHNVNVALLLTSGLGLGSEGGEFQEIIKKLIFQGKPLNAETIFHMKRELGDSLWYWINACRALNLDPNDVIQENVNKLSSRYPGGEFDVHYSENRKEGDL